MHGCNLLLGYILKKRTERIAAFASRMVWNLSEKAALEENESGLLQVICDIATHGSSAADRRRSEVLRTCKTLDELHARLVEDGFCISRTSTNRKLIPKYSGSIEGKRHVTTVPV